MFTFRSNTNASYIGLSAETFKPWAIQQLWTSGRIFVDGLSYVNFDTDETVNNETGKQCVSVMRVCCAAKFVFK